jgi:uncharacterized protein
VGNDFSAMHRLHSDEIYFHHSGSPLRMLLIDPTGVAREVVIGPDVQRGQHPQFHVPAYWWQGASTDGPWCLVSTVVAPGFDWHDFVLGDRDMLLELVASRGVDVCVEARINALTRPEPLL